MTVRYREEKATQAAARLLEHAGGSMKYMKLIKLLYLADRVALLKHGRPITFDWYFSMDHGPVLSFTYDKIKAQPDPGTPSYWHEVISERQGYKISLRKQTAPKDQLSTAEESVLDDVFTRFGQMNEWQLRDYCHQHLPEWQDPQGSCSVIAIRDILRAGGLSEDEVDAIEEDLEGEAAAARLLD
jgi:uncharacterized phage-associated protein